MKEDTKARMEETRQKKKNTNLSFKVGFFLKGLLMLQFLAKYATGLQRCNSDPRNLMPLLKQEQNLKASSQGIIIRNPTVPGLT